VDSDQWLVSVATEYQLAVVQVVLAEPGYLADQGEGVHLGQAHLRSDQCLVLVA
jgi:hypothetical protein